MLREGVYAINVALFTVVTEDTVYRLEVGGAKELKAIMKWQTDLTEVEGFDPVIIGGPVEAPDPFNHDKTIIVDSMGIVTVHDGPSLPPGEIIAPAVGIDRSTKDFHNNFQDPEAFLRAGGRRGLQYVPLTDGTYFINRWFASVETIPKMIVPIGYVGVVVSYYGRSGLDLSGQSFRHGERVSEGERGVQEKPLGPGKYAFNTYAGNIVLVPTTNFVLHWVTGKTEAHRYDESLRSIDLVTKDAYEPSLPLSVVVHIDYQKAPNVIQRFGDVKKLITQTLDPMLSAYFRDVAHKRTMLELLQNRDAIQHEASGELGRKFGNFDIECVDVLIGKPDTEQTGGKIETLLEQLRLRQLSLEQVETYTKQVAAAQTLRRALNEGQARAQNANPSILELDGLQIKIAENEAGSTSYCSAGPRSKPSRSSSPPRPKASSASWPGAAKVRGSFKKGSRRRRSCCERSNRFRTRASTLCRSLRRGYRSATSRWCLSGCLSQAVAAWEPAVLEGGWHDQRRGALARRQRRLRLAAQHARRRKIGIPARRSARQHRLERTSHRKGRW